MIGGIDVSEPSADLGIALAIITCVRDVVFDSHTAIVGEIGLSGEIRAVNHIEKRIIEAEKLGFKMAVVSNKADGPVKQLGPKYFGPVISVALGSRPGVPNKPDPASTLEAVQLLGLKNSEVLKPFIKSNMSL